MRRFNSARPLLWSFASSAGLMPFRKRVVSVIIIVGAPPAASATRRRFRLGWHSSQFQVLHRCVTARWCRSPDVAMHFSPQYPTLLVCLLKRDRLCFFLADRAEPLWRGMHIVNRFLACRTLVFHDLVINHSKLCLRPFVEWFCAVLFVFPASFPETTIGRRSEMVAHVAAN